MNILVELHGVGDREDVLILNDTEGTLVNVEEAIKAAEKGDIIEIHYLKYSQNKSDAIVQFNNFWYVDGDLFDLDAFVWCEATEDLIDSDAAVWCDDVQDFRHIDDIYTDFYGNIYGSDDDLLYSEKKDYYIYSADAVKIYEDNLGNYFWVHCDDLDNYYYHEYTEKYYTYPSDSLIRDYQKTTLSPISSGNKLYYIGVELEMENDMTDREEREEDILTILNSEKGKTYYGKLLDWKEDRSLEDGVEMVTAPISLEIFKKDIIPIVKRLQEIGYTSEQGGRCGNHIHISKSAFDEQAQARLVLIYARFESIIKKLSRRNGNTEYCKDVLDRVNTISLDNAEEVVKNQKTKRKSTAINFNNYNTIEFRVFRGTMNTDVLIANIQLVQLIADLALRDLSVQNILDLTFTKLVEKMIENNYKELLNYCDKKGLLDWWTQYR